LAASTAWKIPRADLAAYGPPEPARPIDRDAGRRVAGDGIDPVSGGHPLAFAGLSYVWRTIVLSAEVENASAVSYAFRIGKRF
jgi:hypothetical protein